MATARLSRLAEEDLLDIWGYIAQDNPAAADRFTDLLVQKCDNLCDFPELGTRRDELAPSLRSFPVGRYVIYYLSEISVGAEDTDHLDARIRNPNFLAEAEPAHPGYRLPSTLDA